MGNTSSIKQQVGKSTVTPRQSSTKIQNELQYDMAGAYSMVAFKNQADGSQSDLDLAKANFENNYKKFLILYGQYSNKPLRQYPTNTLFEYPINQDTQVFKNYPNLKPKTIQTVRKGFM
jgi:hypothetical protein